MEIQIYFGDDPENEYIQRPMTIDELGLILEGKANQISVDGKNWCVLAVDDGNTYRNTDKEGGGYIKFYPNCKTLSGDMSKQKVYRIYTDLDKDGKAVYTIHNGMGKGSGTITKDDCEMFVAAAATIVTVDGKDKMLFDMFDDDLKNGTSSKFTIPSDKNGKKSKIIRASTKNIKERVKGTKLEPFLNIEYDGKRKL